MNIIKRISDKIDLISNKLQVVENPLVSVKSRCVEIDDEFDVMLMMPRVQKGFYIISFKSDEILCIKKYNLIGEDVKVEDVNIGEEI